MSTILQGVLRMPRELREADFMSQGQFDACVIEAADTIERLEAEVCDLRKQNTAFMEADSKAMSVCMADNDRLEAENAELRAKLANGFGRNGPAPPLPSFVTDSMSQISDSEGE